MLKVRLTENYHCKDISKSEKTGTLINQDIIYQMTPITLYFIYSFLAFKSLPFFFYLLFAHVPIWGRFKSRKKIGLPSGSLEMYVNHQARTQPSNGQSSRSGTSSPPQHGLSHTLCSSADNHTKNFTPFVDLNSKGEPKFPHLYVHK